MFDKTKTKNNRRKFEHEYRYVLVRDRMDSGDPLSDVHRLLADGWVPARETSITSGADARSFPPTALVLLSRVVEIEEEEE